MIDDWQHAYLFVCVNFGARNQIDINQIDVLVSIKVFDFMMEINNEDGLFYCNKIHHTTIDTTFLNSSVLTQG